MEEEFWLKYGFKQNGELTCVRILSQSKPDEKFFYTENGKHEEVENPNVLKLTPEIIGKINGLKNIGADKK